jgi:hypothetical protein
MKATAHDGGRVEIGTVMLDNLKLHLRGQVIIAGGTDYDECRTVWNAMIDKKPSIVVRCLGTADVIECIRFAQEHGLLLSIKGGGHNIAGLAAIDDGMMLDMSLMRGVWVDSQGKVAHAQAGCLLGDVDSETQLAGLAAVLGFNSATGLAGLTLGGGFGYLTRRWGWTSDNVVGMNIITAEGRLVRASDDENEDLFWGLRGGGGNFGVVTSIDYLLYPVGPEIIGGIVAWPLSEAPGVFELYRNLAGSAPPELTLVIILRRAPGVVWLPKEVHGKLIVAILACYSGNPEEGEKVVAPIKSFGKPVGDILKRRPYVEMQSLLDRTQPKGRRNYWKNEYLPGIEPALGGKLINHAAKITSPHTSVILFQIEGALNNIADDFSATDNRNAHYILNMLGSWEKVEDDNLNIEWVREAWNDLKPFSTGGNYINFQTEDEGSERMEAALGRGLHKLVSIKTKWDPLNMFRSNRNIKPD